MPVTGILWRSQIVESSKLSPTARMSVSGGGSGESRSMSKPCRQWRPNLSPDCSSSSSSKSGRSNLRNGICCCRTGVQRTAESNHNGGHDNKLWLLPRPQHSTVTTTTTTRSQFFNKTITCVIRTSTCPLALLHCLLVVATVATLLVPPSPLGSTITVAALPTNITHGSETKPQMAMAQLPILQKPVADTDKAMQQQQQQGAREHRNWLRVLSSKAAHPAMYVPGDGLVYCPIAKVACAEWRKTLRWMLGIPDWDSGPIHDQGKNGIPLLAGRKPREVERVLNDDSWLKFAVVRDPADRLLSGFLNKCVGGEWGNCPYVEFMPHRFEGVNRRNGETDKIFMQAIRDDPKGVFRDFVLGVRKDVRIRGCRVNSHWRPQYCFCSLARFLPSYHVIPFANMSTEAVALVDKMVRPSPERANLLREFFLHRFSNNFDQKQQGAETKRDKFFSREAVDGIKQVYEKDYTLFGAYFEEHEPWPS